MDWAIIWSSLFFASSLFCFSLMWVATIRVWLAQKRAIRSYYEYRSALDRARMLLEHDPEFFVKIADGADPMRSK